MESDEELVRRLARGDAPALRALMDRYRGPLHGYLCRLLGSAPDAEDLFQDTFVRVLRHAARFDGKRTFRPWLYAIATNQAIDALRRRNRRTADRPADIVSAPDEDGEARPLFELLPAPGDAPPDAIVKLWLERWNAISDAVETHEALASLYAPEALHLEGPSPDQRGTATFRGPEGVRALAARIAAAEEHRTWRIETDTARETTAPLVFTIDGPWGGPGVAVQLVAVHTDRATKKRYATPRAAFSTCVRARPSPT